MVVWPEFRTRQYRDDDYREDASHFTIIGFECQAPKENWLRIRVKWPKKNEANSSGFWIKEVAIFIQNIIPV